MVVQHNMQAMNANRMLNVTMGSQAKSTEKLSSGYRINRAADDAAGLSISEKMRKQIRGLDQASSNAQDGVSSVQTAEGALAEVHDMLHRMNELAVQAANGTNSESDRSAIQDEINQLNDEIDRVAETTKFNETFLLKGDPSGATKDIKVNAHDAGLLGDLVDNGDGTATFTAAPLAAGDKVTIAGIQYTIGAGSDDVDAFLTDNFPTAANGGAKITVDGVEYTYYDKAVGDDDLANPGWYAEQPAAADKGTATPKFADSDAVKTQVMKGSTLEIGAEKITGLLDENDNGVDDIDTSKISVKEAHSRMAGELAIASSIGTTTPAEVTNNEDGTFSIKLGEIKTKESLKFDLHVGSDAAMSNKIIVEIESLNAAGLGVKGLNLVDATGIKATYAIDAIADGIQRISAQRASLGAVQNRLEHTIKNLDNVVENTTSAESQIRDTDMAEEMVTYSKNNILAQAGQSMLAQANQATQGVMSLLQ